MEQGSMMLDQAGPPRRAVTPKLKSHFANRQVPASKILVVDDHELVRIGIRSVLQMSGETSMEILEAANLHDAMDVYRDEPHIALVLLDLNMPDCRGLHGLKQFLETFPQARVAVLSGTQDEFVVGQVRALGAIGYVTKGQAPKIMADFVLGLLRSDGEAAGGGQACAPPNGFVRFPKSSKYDRVAELGERHLEILDHVLFGCSNQEISNATGLSLGTIKNYVSTILLALDVKSRSHLISLFR
ncbi:MAG: response regulator transcription factor [Rhizobacter sp.]|nr:response regulator transcription factor [Rhizobacter sp.]